MENLIHFLLVTSNRLQHLSVLVLAALLFAMSGAVYATWQSSGASQETALAVGGLILLGAGVNGLMLWLLPRVGRSFGPEKPPLVALMTLMSLLAILCAGLGLPVGAVVLITVGLTAVAIYSTWVEPFRLGVTQQRLCTPAFARGTHPLRLLHIGDLHVERISPRERRLNQLVAELKPDLIVFSGDFVNISYHHDLRTEADIRAVIGAWQAPLGVYCVRGTPTVESWPRVRAFTAGFDHITVLDNDWVCIEAPQGPLNILGLTTWHDLSVDRAALHENAAPPGPGFRLLLTHSPDIIPEADALNFDLYLCGHTHGGQLRLPIIGAILSGSALGRRFVMGRYDLQNMTAYTTRGVGLEGMGAPRARFLCPPEIVLWEITSPDTV